MRSCARDVGSCARDVGSNTWKWTYVSCTWTYVSCTWTHCASPLMTNDKQNHFLNACHESWPPWYLDHLDYADQLNHSDNPDWSMINQNDNCRIRIGLVHVWNCFKEALTGSGCGDPEMSKKPRRNETRSYNAVDDILLRHMIMPHRGTGNPN